MSSKNLTSETPIYYKNIHILFGNIEVFFLREGNLCSENLEIWNVEFEISTKNNFEL